MSVHAPVQPEIAMVSRIRVEVRGASMAACEQVAFSALDHARLAGVLEGFAPTSGQYTDHFFNRPEVTGKHGDPPEVWGELGLLYGGRLSFTFEPESVFGGLKQFGYQVERDLEIAHPGVTAHGFIVLERQRPVTRNHSWEGVTSVLVAEETGEAILDDIRSIRDVVAVRASIESDGGASVRVTMDGWEDVRATGETLREAALAARKRVVEMLHEGTVATADEIIDNIERLVGVAHVTVRELPTEWRVLVAFTEDDGRVPVEGRGGSKREAALNAYGLCGVEVTHFDTTPLVPGTPQHAAAERIAGV